MASESKTNSVAGRTIKVSIKRQATPDAHATTETFEIPYRPNMNITSLLGEIALNPRTVNGTDTTPITYDSNCLEEICGSCAMLINGKAMICLLYTSPSPRDRQ